MAKLHTRNCCASIVLVRVKPTGTWVQIFSAERAVNVCERARLIDWCVNSCFRRLSGDVPALVRGSKAASKLADYYNEREKLLGDKMSAEEFEAKWGGVRIAGEEVLADAPTIFEMEDADVLRMENLYASVGSAE